MPAIVRGTGYRLFDARGAGISGLPVAVRRAALRPQPAGALGGARRRPGPRRMPVDGPAAPAGGGRAARGAAGALAPGDLEICTFANSGAEVVEAAIKLARARTGRDVILSTTNGFHGKTLGALSATGKPLYQIDFAAPAPGFDYVPYGDIDALAARLKADGEPDRRLHRRADPGRGRRRLPARRLPRRGDRALPAPRRAQHRRRDPDRARPHRRALRVGARRRAPDMLLLAKALGGGMMPIGACIVRPEVWDDRFGLLHSSTFANNNLACRVANATLDLLERDDRTHRPRGRGERRLPAQPARGAARDLSGGDPRRARPRLHGRARVRPLRPRATTRRRWPSAA